MNKAALFVLIALAAGLGVGYLLGSNAPATAERTERQNRPAYEPPPVERDPDRPRTKLTEALDDMPAPQFPVGKGRITGIVKTDDGKPLRDVRVRATPRWRGRSYRRGQALPPEELLEEYVRKRVEYYHRQRGTRRDAATAADGSYTIGGLLESEKYTVQAYLEGYEFRVQTGHTSYEVAPGTKIDFVAKRIAELHVDVVMPDGTRPERVTLRFREKNRSESAQWMPEYPSVGVTPGTYRLTATLDGDSDYTSEPVEIEVFSDKPNPSVTIHMRSQPGIRGTVKLEGATSYLSIHAVKMRPDEPPPLDRIREGKRGHLGRGNYTFKGLAPGRYLIAVALSSETVLDSRVVEVTDHMVRCDFDIKEFNPTEFLSVRVYGPDGKPVPEVKFSTAFRTKTSSSLRGGYAIVLKGRYLVAHHKGDAVDGTNYVTARSDRFGTKEIAYSREKTRELEIRFGAPAKLAVTVTGYTGSAQGKLAMRLARKGAQRHSAYREEKKVPDNGTVTLGPTEAGEYELLLYVQVNRFSRLRVSTTPIALRAGNNAATVAAPRLYALTIVVADGRGQVQIGPDPRDDGSFHAYQNLGKTGRVTFQNLVAGRYKVTNGGEAMVVDLRGTQTVTFRAQVVNAMRVTITDPKGAFTAAGFVHGDLIIGVDGTEFKNRRHMGILLMTSGKEPITLNILRGGRRIELTVNVQSLRGGGRLDSTTR